MAKLNGMDISWYEGSGVIEREWMVRGDAHDIKTIHASLTQWIKENHLSDDKT